MAKTYRKRRRIRKSRRRVRRGGNEGNEGRDVSSGITPSGFEQTVKTLWGNMQK